MDHRRSLLENLANDAVSSLAAIAIQGCNAGGGHFIG
jgi:hypothetical protein